MKTEQAIRKLGQTLWDILGREYIDKYCEDKNGNLVSVSSISVDGIAEELVNAGYGDVSEYKAEIEQLKEDYAKLQEQFAQYQMASDKEIRAQVKQAKIDVLNELKEKCKFDGHTVAVYKNDIDELIKEVQNEN